MTEHPDAADASRAVIARMDAELKYQDQLMERLAEQIGEIHCMTTELVVIYGELVTRRAAFGQIVEEGSR